jgi:hypothetical protein
MTGRFTAGYGRNLEAACMPYARAERLRHGTLTGRTCGGTVECRAESAKPGRDGVVRVYCGPGCQDAGRMEDEAN